MSAIRWFVVFLSDVPSSSSRRSVSPFENVHITIFMLLRNVDKRNLEMQILKCFIRIWTISVYQNRGFIMSENAEQKKGSWTLPYAVHQEKKNSGSVSKPPYVFVFCKTEVYMGILETSACSMLEGENAVTRKSNWLMSFIFDRDKIIFFININYYTIEQKKTAEPALCPVQSTFPILAIIFYIKIPRECAFCWLAHQTKERQERWKVMKAAKKENKS